MDRQHREVNITGAQRTMWKASAVRAREWARKPAMSSSRKKAVSMTSMIFMRVLLDHAHFEEPAMAATSGAGAHVGLVEDAGVARATDQWPRCGRGYVTTTMMVMVMVMDGDGMEGRGGEKSGPAVWKVRLAVDAPRLYLPMGAASGLPWRGACTCGPGSSRGVLQLGKYRYGEHAMA